MQAIKHAVFHAYPKIRRAIAPIKTVASTPHSAIPSRSFAGRLIGKVQADNSTQASLRTGLSSTGDNVNVDNMNGQ